jgi:hypothetical protein
MCLSSPPRTSDRLDLPLCCGKTDWAQEEKVAYWQEKSPRPQAGVWSTTRAGIDNALAWRNASSAGCCSGMHPACRRHIYAVVEISQHTLIAVVPP